MFNKVTIKAQNKLFKCLAQRRGVAMAVADY
jgi:hypothetical protein